MDWAKTEARDTRYERKRRTETRCNFLEQKSRGDVGQKQCLRGNGRVGERNATQQAKRAARERNREANKRRREQGCNGDKKGSVERRKKTH